MKMRDNLPVIQSTERQLTCRGVLWLGLKCDIRCKFCYDNGLSTADKIWITLEDATRALDKFRYYYQNRYIDFMGGEPTLHPKILEIVRYAADIGLRPTIITHGMQLADFDRAKAYVEAGIHDFLVSIHGIGDTVREIHGRGTENFNKQTRALDNLRTLGVPFRFNCILIRDNLPQLEAIVELAGRKGARVVNFVNFNPYFEWSSEIDIEFQVRHSEIAPYLAKAIDKCISLGVEANARYIPLCQLLGREAHVYTVFQLPYDTHEWDFNSWYDLGHPGIPSPAWYLEASREQQQRHHHIYVPTCGACAAKAICDGFHAQYVARFGSEEAAAYSGQSITDPRYFIQTQRKVQYVEPSDGATRTIDERHAASLSDTQFSVAEQNRAGVKARRPHTMRS